QKIIDVLTSMIDLLLGFAMLKVTSVYLIPFADLRGGWMDHVRMKVFLSITMEHNIIKYLQPQHSSIRIYFPLTTLDTILRSTEPLYIIENEKKSLSIAQLNLPTIKIYN